MTPRESLRGLLAIPYWVLVFMVALLPGGLLVRWWAFAEGAAVAVAGITAQSKVTGWVADWAWRHVEVLAQEWRELARTTADNPLTSRNTVDKAEVQR